MSDRSQQHVKGHSTPDFERISSNVWFGVNLTTLVDDLFFYLVV